MVSRRLIGLPLRVVDQDLTLLRGLLWGTIQLVGSVNKLNQNFLDSSENGTPAPSLSNYLYSPNKVGKTDNNIQNKSTYLWLPPTRMAVLLSTTEASVGREPLLMPRCILTLSSGLFYIWVTYSNMIFAGRMLAHLATRWSHEIGTPDLTLPGWPQDTLPMNSSIRGIEIGMYIPSSYVSQEKKKIM